MIDERIEVEHYIKGENIRKENMYRMCYIIAKYMRDQGKSALETRQYIFSWANENRLFIKCNVNDILNIVYTRDLDPLTTGKEIYVSTADIKNIDMRFDLMSTKKTALAMLCVAKAFGNKSREFTCSAVSVSSWIGISKTYFFKQIKELILFDFLEQIDTTKSHLHRWQDRPLCVANGNTYKILFPYENSGEYKLKDDNIEELFSNIYCA